MNNLTKCLMIALGLSAFGAGPALAQDIIYSARVSGGTFTTPFYEVRNGGTAYATSTGKGTAAGVNASRAGCFFHTASTLVLGQGFGCQLVDDTAGQAGQTWAVYVNVPSSNDSNDLLMNITSTNSLITSDLAGTTPITTTTAFQVAIGGGSLWGLVGYIKVTSGSGLHPHILFTYNSGVNLRSYADSIKFSACSSPTAAVTVRPPYTTNMTSVIVAGVDATATKVSVYQRVGIGSATLLGSITSGIVAGDNTVPVSGLTPGANISATQTVGGQEGCPTAGNPIGSGPNSAIRVSFNMRYNPAFSGPIGAGGGAAGQGFYFMPNTAGVNAGYPQGGIQITPSTCWQTVKIDPRTVTHGNFWAGCCTGDPGRPAWGAIDSFVFDMSSVGNSGPYAIYIDNLANGSTMIHDFEDAWTSWGVGGNVAPSGVFDTFANAGSTYPLVNASPLVTSVSCSTNVSTPSQCAGGTNAQYINWQWNQAGSPGVWLRMVANSPKMDTTWPSFPQIDMNKPITFDILVLPIGQTAGHSVGTVSTMDDQTVCPGGSSTLSVTATAPTDPATGNPLPRSYTYLWSKNGTAISGATDSSYAANAAGTYSVVVNDGTCSVTRDAIVTVPVFAEWNFGGRIQPSLIDDGRQVINVGDPLQITYTAFPVASSPCGDPLDYHWIKNGAIIPGATTPDNYTVASATIADAGTYSLMVSNQFGSMVNTNVSVWYVVAPSPVIGTGAGLLASYWTVQKGFTNAPNFQQTTNISVDWLLQSPDTLSISVDHFTARWNGTFLPEYSQTYTFYSTNDDGLRLWVNNQLVIDSWVDQGPGTGHKGTPIALTGGSAVPITCDYYENTGGAVAKVLYECPSIPLQIAPIAQLTASSSYQPGIALASPINGSSAAAPATFSLQANVATNELVILKVEFYTNNVLLAAATRTVPPYTYSWAGVPVGTYAIKARVRYNQDATGENLDSSTSTVTVNNPTPPSITGMTSDGVNAMITGSGSAGQHYFLQKTTDVGHQPHPIWSNISTQGPASSFSFSTPVGSDSAAFFRVGAY